MEDSTKNQLLNNKKLVIAAIGDTQRPLLSLEKNHHVRQLLLKNLASYSPNILIHLGDFVATGESTKDWDYLNSVMAPIYQSQIPVLPVIGNHDLFWSKKRALTQFKLQFPSNPERGFFATKLSEVAIIILNSNNNCFSNQAWQEQVEWFENTLKTFEEDSGVKQIIICSHHPPYTNSMVIRPHSKLKHDFAIRSSQSKKVKLFISGHAHTFEHFKINECHFIVSGGGGGQRQPILPPSFSREKDLEPWSLFKPFHFVLIEVESNQINLKIVGINTLKNDTSIIKTITF